MSSQTSIHQIAIEVDASSRYECLMTTIDGRLLVEDLVTLEVLTIRTQADWDALEGGAS